LSEPNQFCFLFYRAFYTTLFEKPEDQDEINMYLVEAGLAAQGSKSKELLFEAVRNLAIALNEVQNLENLDLNVMKSELNFYRKYCDHAVELMKDAEEKAPYATAAMRKGLPIFDRHIKRF
jgi:HEAT repeat protein